MSRPQEYLSRPVPIGVPPIVTAGHHRKVAGLRDAIRFLWEDEGAARAVAEVRGRDCLVFCRGAPAEREFHGLPPFKGTVWPRLSPLSMADEHIHAVEAATR